MLEGLIVRRQAFVHGPRTSGPLSRRGVFGIGPVLVGSIYICQVQVEGVPFVALLGEERWSTILFARHLNWSEETRHRRP